MNLAAPRAERQRLLLDAAALLPFAAIALAYADFVPMWDAREYADCIVKAARGSFPRDYVCAEHPTIAWVWFLALLERFAHGAFWPILVMNVALGLVGLASFLGIARTLFPDRGWEARALTAVLGVMPVWQAGAVSISPDFGVVAFFLAFVWALLNGRFWLAALAGALCTFSKEPGVLLVTLSAGLYWVVFVTRSDLTEQQKARRTFQLVPTLASVPLFAAWLLLKGKAGDSMLWQAQDPRQLLRTFTRVDLLEPHFLGQLACIFVLQFCWLLTLPVVVRWLRAAVRWTLNRPPSSSTPVVFVDVLFVPATALLTRFQTFLNVRYYLALYPLLLLCAYSAVRAAPRALRWGGIGAVGAAFAVSLFFTADPLSRRLAGTFAFGDRQVLKIVNLGDGCCGWGRDQLVYNLQHTQFHYLQNDIYAALRPDEQVLFAPAGTDWHFAGLLEAGTRRRTLGAPGAKRAQIASLAELAGRPPPQRLIWVRFPNFDARREESIIAGHYDVAGTRTFARGPYRIEATSYVLRPRAVQR